MMNTERYGRQVMLSEVGPEGQERLRRAHVLIVGAGGLGSPTALYLAGAGVGHITICDADRVSCSNLQRQILYDTPSQGREKAVMAKDRLTALNPDVEVRAVCADFTEENADELVRDADIVVDCTDNFATRFLIDAACRRASKPWVFGAIGEFAGQVSLFGAGSGKTLADLYPEFGRSRRSDAVPGGVLGPVPGVVGALEALEAMKVVVGFGETLDGRVLVIDFLTLQTNIIAL